MLTGDAGDRLNVRRLTSGGSSESQLCQLLFRFDHFRVGLGELEPKRLRQVRIESYSLSHRQQQTSR